MRNSYPFWKISAALLQSAPTLHALLLHQLHICTNSSQLSCHWFHRRLQTASIYLDQLHLTVSHHLLVQKLLCHYRWLWHRNKESRTHRNRLGAQTPRESVTNSQREQNSSNQESKTIRSQGQWEQSPSDQDSVMTSRREQNPSDWKSNEEKATCHKTA